MCIRVSPKGPNVGEVWASSMPRGEGRDAVAKTDLVRIYFQSSSRLPPHGVTACSRVRASATEPTKPSCSGDPSPSNKRVPSWPAIATISHSATASRSRSDSWLPVQSPHAGEPGPARSGTTPLTPKSYQPPCESNEACGDDDGVARTGRCLEDHISTPYAGTRKSLRKRKKGGGCSLMENIHEP
jgi:hypothetical protein